MLFGSDISARISGRSALMTHERRIDRLARITAIAVGAAVMFSMVLLSVSGIKISGIVVHRRMSWTPFVALSLLISTIAMPERRWRRALWLPWALMSVALAGYAYHVVNYSVCRGLVRVFAIPTLVILSALSAIAAIYELIGQKTSSVGYDQPPKVSGTPTDTPM